MRSATLQADLPCLAESLTRRFPELRLQAGGSAAGFTPLAALADPAGATLAGFLAAPAAIHPGIDRKAQAALLLGLLTRGLAGPAAALAAESGCLPSPDGLSIRLETYRWEVGSRSGTALRPGLRLAAMPDRLPPGAAPVAPLHDWLLARLAPLVTALGTASGLSAGALWRVAADMVCLACLQLAEQAGEGGAPYRRLGLDLVRQPGSPLNNGRTGLQQVVLPDPAAPARVLAERDFLRRGGCCRLYTCAGHGKCSTCLLRPAAEQQSLLRDYLARLHAAA
jgi:hypothetical protein